MAKKNTIYPKESAGAICDKSVARVRSGTSVAEVRKLLQKDGSQYDTLNYIYVVDARGVLMGVISLKELFLNPSASSVNDFMQRKIVHVRPNTDQEHITNLALKHKLKSIPVIDSKGHLIGAVPPHTILQILHDENVEDLLKEAGVAHKSLGRKGGIFSQIRQRMPWLLLGTLGGFLAAVIVHRFESALAEEVLLAAFIPAIVYLADATGTQVQTIYIRAYAFGLSNKLRTSILRELLVAAVLGAIISGILAFVVLLWFGEAQLAMIVAIASLVSIILSGAFSVMLPWVFIRLKYDPAVASGPLGTIVRDIGAITIYFLIAEQILKVSY